MKNVFVSLMVLFLSAISMNGNAQIEKGQFEIGLDMSANSGQSSAEGGSTSDSDAKGIVVGPRLGYFVSDNIQIGIASSFSNRKSKNNVTPSVSVTNSWEVGPYAAYYHEVGERLYLRGTLGSSFGQRDRKYTGPLTTDFSDGKSFNTSLDFGVTYATKGKLSFGLNIGGIGYYSSESRQDIGEVGETTYTNSGVSLNVLNTGDRDFNNGLVNVSLRLY